LLVPGRAPTRQEKILQELMRTEEPTEEATYSSTCTKKWREHSQSDIEPVAAASLQLLSNCGHDFRDDWIHGRLPNAIVCVLYDVSDHLA
jgi:hypothetical protein